MALLYEIPLKKLKLEEDLEMFIKLIRIPPQFSKFNISNISTLKINNSFLVSQEEKQSKLYKTNI